MPKKKIKDIKVGELINFKTPGPDGVNDYVEEITVTYKVKGKNSGTEMEMDPEYEVDTLDPSVVGEPITEDVLRAAQKRNAKRP